MKLKKDLKLLDVFCITTGAMLSSGLFILPGLAHVKAGPSILISYFLAGLLAFAGLLSQAELASAMPKAGGTYFYVTRSMGSAVGTVYGLLTLLALALKSAFELIGMAAFTLLIINLDIHIVATSLCLIFILVNLLGAKEAGRVQIILVSIILGTLSVFVIKGIPLINVTHYEPFTPYGVKSIISTAGFVFLSYGGLLKIASLAEEIENPGWVLPMGMILSLIVISIFYSLVLFVTIGVLDDAPLNSTLTPISDAAELILGSWGKILLSITAILAFTSAANAGILGASRYPYALAKDDLLPNIFSRINKKFNTPHYSILLTGGCMIAALFLKLNVIIKAASAVLIVTYIFSCLALIIMRESHLQNYQPKFNSPLYPWVQFIGLIGFIALLFGIGLEAFYINLILIAFGFFVFWFYGRIRVAREFALLHLIERITSKELTTHSLETELKEIIKERDEITKDRFDQIIEDSIVLDVEESMTLDNFFNKISISLSEHLNKSPEQVYNLLKAREEESSTVISPGLAIPHIVIDGENVFNILIARCKGGVAFSGDTPEVHAVFVLIGSRDERNFHLRSLSAIAQIVQASNFEKKWMAAKSKEALKDIMLLGERKR